VDVPARVEQLGFESRYSGLSREENPYLEVSPLSRVKLNELRIARELADAWWRGWDRANQATRRYAKPDGMAMETGTRRRR
jgi:hypothetical protein